MRNMNSYSIEYSINNEYNDIHVDILSIGICTIYVINYVYTWYYITTTFTLVCRVYIGLLGVITPIKYILHIYMQIF